MRLVLDTDVVVAALRSPSGASAALLRAVLADQATLLLSPALALEYEAVLSRPEHCTAAGMTPEDVERVCLALCEVARPVTIHTRWRPQAHDPNDDFVLEAAINGRADALVSFNIRHLGPAAARFGVAVVRPGEIVRRLLS